VGIGKEQDMSGVQVTVTVAADRLGQLTDEEVLTTARRAVAAAVFAERLAQIVSQMRGGEMHGEALLDAAAAALRDACKAAGVDAGELLRE
jgi:hypothetical protein